MPIHSILPPEAFQEQEPRPATLCKPCRRGFAECLPLPDGRYRICRIISTDPAAYLDPEFFPGAVAEASSPFFLKEFPAG